MTSYHVLQSGLQDGLFLRQKNSCLLFELEYYLKLGWFLVVVFFFGLLGINRAGVCLPQATARESYVKAQ